MVFIYFLSWDETASELKIFKIKIDSLKDKDLAVA